MRHILDRFVLHLFASPGVLLASSFALAMLCRKKTTWTWLPQTRNQQIVLAAVCVFAGSALREAWDVAHGQSLVKAFFDYASWFSGCSLGVWALFRLQKQ